MSALLEHLRKEIEEASAPPDIRNALEKVQQAMKELSTQMGVGDEMKQLRQWKKELEDKLSASAEEQSGETKQTKQDRPRRGGVGTVIEDVTVVVKTAKEEWGEWRVEGKVAGYARVHGIGIPDKDKVDKKVKRTLPPFFRIPVGMVGVALRPTGIADQEQIPEVYVGGESLRVQASEPAYPVVLVKEHLLDFRLEIYQRLAGISLGEKDSASFRLGVEGRLVDPIAFLRRSAGGTTIDELERNVYEVQKSLAEIIPDVCASILNEEGKVNLWSSDRDEVVGYFIEQFRAVLQNWGIQVHEAVCVRKYPRRLYHTALQFMQAEQRLWENLQEENFITLGGYSIPERHIRRLQIMVEEGYPRGEWLVRLLSQAQEAIPPLQEWLREIGAEAAALFVADIFNHSKTTPAQALLSIQVLLAALRKPQLTLGEWLEGGTVEW